MYLKYVAKEERSARRSGRSCSHADRTSSFGMKGRVLKLKLVHETVVHIKFNII